MKIKIYSGLSLSRTQIQTKIPDAVIAPPIKRNDLVQDMRSGIHLVIIVDGEFDQQLAVSSGEIVDALRAGIKIYGCSSMGAMRAVECEKHGMIGSGKIFEYIKKNSLFRDDYLAQVFHDVSDSALSSEHITWIDLYFACLRSIQENVITQEFADLLLREYSNLFYTNRNISNLKDIVSKNRALAANENEFFAALAKQPSQKSLDALDAIDKAISDTIRIRSVNDTINSTSQSSDYTSEYYPSAMVDRHFFKGD